MIVTRNSADRAEAAARIRHLAASAASLRPHPTHTANGEETAYRNSTGLSYIANYSKGLPHTPDGEVEPQAYRSLLRAIASGDPRDFEDIALGAGRKLVNPQAGLAFDLQGPDAQAVTMPPAPRIDSPQVAGEMAELYWMALLRDVPFRAFETDPGVADAAASLSALADFRGPKDNGTDVTSRTIFRGFTRGDLVGPFVSQFLLKPVVFGTLQYPQRQRTAVAGQDYMRSYPEWLAIQNGASPSTTGAFDPVRRHIRTMRDLATYVHFDALHEAYFNACLILLDMGARPDHGNFYRDSRTQEGFGTYGAPHILSLLPEVATRALKAVWHQKWFVHRRLRPEAFGGLVHRHATGRARYPLHPDITDTSSGGLLDRVRAANKAAGHESYLLPQAFPEGSPAHPSYGSGHATVAGACVTVLKAWFDESEVFDPDVVSHPDPEVEKALKEARRPKVSNMDGTKLENYVAPPDEAPLTVGGELDKLAANIAIGRDMAGVHWRTDYEESLKLGESIALAILEEQSLCYNEPFRFTLTKFDGATVTV